MTDLRDIGSAVRSPAPGAALHIDVLDGIRGVAALVVVAAHLSYATGLLAGHFSRAGGQLGVMLFFALSGFLLAHIYLRQPVTMRSLRDYAVARIARVLPLFYLIVLASYILLETPIELYDVNDANLFDHLLLYSGVNVLWTIPVEIRFYGLFPVLWLLWKWSARTAIFGVLAVLVAYYTIEPGTMPVMKLGHYFLIGFLVRALATFELRGAQVVREVVFVLSAAIFAALLTGPIPVFDDPRIWWNPVAALSVFTLLASAIKSRIAAWLLGNPIMRFLGTISYGIYLLHMIVIINGRDIIDPKTMSFVFIIFVLGTTLLLSWIMYHVFEAPTRRAIRGYVGSLLPRRIGGRKTG